MTCVALPEKLVGRGGGGFMGVAVCLLIVDYLPGTTQG